uniref:Uncharacterized protein n=1 Tax=Anguilla anguilla TaxID=7936 RepID=A0A0E9VKW3_ANGAN
MWPLSFVQSGTFSLY